MPDQSNRNTVIFMVCAALMLIAYQVFVMGPQAKRREAELKARGGDQVQTVPGAAASIQKAVYLPRDQAAAKSPRVQIDTPAVYGSVALKGARIDDLYLKGYRQTVDPKSPAVELLRPEGAEHAWFAEFGWAGANLPGLPTPDTVWTLAEGAKLAPGQPITLRYDNGQGLVFSRKIAVDDKFMFTVTDTVANTAGQAVTLAPYASVQRQGIPADVNRSTAHEGAVGVLDGALRMFKYKDWKKNGEKDFSSNGGWLGITDKYWLAAVVPDQGENVHSAFRVTQAGGVDIYESNFVAQSHTIAPGQAVTHVSHMFAGAKTVPVLKAYQTDLKIPRFTDAVDWGVLYFFTKPIFWMLEQFNALFHNFGLSILALTVVVKVAFFYPANLSFESMTKMKKIQPETEALRTKFKDDPAKQQQELMALYQREKINPLLGCLPMLATIPVFLALFKVLNVAIEMRHAPFFGWVQDLSSRDPSTVLNLFGLIPWDPATTPMIGTFLAGSLHIGVWPLLYGLFQWLTMAMSPPAPDPTQQKMMQMMPIIFTFVLSQMAVGLLIYYTWSNLLTILQQYVIMRRFKVDNPIDRIIARVTGKPVEAS
ncbi:membrane protein insertase YidC [Phenylobacterium aquaticum]|uniref:membrane protein insertase YidC n=1 Tax=Phenylobacterium aquaticum TaxID=1763816 RepID=UPI001F5DE2A7|nr:membrane protein insertase YidC [Phenylobacterium aquaticum]MCI3132973.1 membrane protein insertase YidC [Phenylobacterium aquaticum]